MPSCCSTNLDISTPNAFWLLPVRNIRRQPSLRHIACPRYFNDLISAQTSICGVWLCQHTDTRLNLAQADSSTSTHHGPTLILWLLWRPRPGPRSFHGRFVGAPALRSPSALAYQPGRRPVSAKCERPGTAGTPEALRSRPGPWVPVSPAVCYRLPRSSVMSDNTSVRARLGVRL
jgi:hypothetical protein